MADTTLRIEAPPSTETVTITAAGRGGGEPLAVIRGHWSPPRMRPDAPERASWRFGGRSEDFLELAGIGGRLTVDTYAAAGLELQRQVWVSAEGAVMATRQKLVNGRTGAIQLDALEPLRCDGPGSLLILGQGAESWEVLAQKRFKNDGPTPFRPGIADGDLEMAQKPIGPTGEAQEETGDGVTSVRADPFCVLRSRTQSGTDALLLGYLSQRGHLARLAMRFAEGDTGGVALDHLIAECEFDGVRVDPGEERTSQWLWVAAGETNELIADFADRVGIYHDIARPVEPAPSVFCAFYVYGEYYTERWFEEDTEDLAARHVPFDVFLVDGGWERTRGDWEPKPEPEGTGGAPLDPWGERQGLAEVACRATHPLYLACISRMPLACLSHVSRMYLACISRVSHLTTMRPSNSTSNGELVEPALRPSTYNPRHVGRDVAHRSREG